MQFVREGREEREDVRSRKPLPWSDKGCPKWMMLYQFLYIK